MKPKLKILCICEWGNVRSVALAYLIKSIYRHEVIAIGYKASSSKTMRMLFKWADKIILLAHPEEAMKILPVTGTKGIFHLDVGEDIWHDAKHQELLHKLYKQLHKLDL